ncbi:MAG: thermonuclease family protein [Thermoplasmata archaeon]
MTWRKAVWVVVLVAVAVVVAVAGVLIGIRLSPTPTPVDTQCLRSDGLCIEREVTQVIDGDTLDVEGGLRIRLVLVDAPELTESGGPAARDYLTDLCLGSLALIDEDDFQIGDDPYGRILAVVYCDENANAAMISSGHADTYYDFCAESEFGSASWTGCSSPPPPPPEDDCDPAYPDVCIPSPPPDLDCGDIPYRNFRVFPPDPHHFDGDGDGIGCET